MWNAEPVSRVLAILAGLLVILLGWGIAHLVRAALGRTIHRFIDDDRAVRVLVAAPYYLILLIGALIGLDRMGVEILPVLTGLGLGGFVVGLALRDALSNLVSGMMMLLYKPFSPGDSITVSGYSGKVEEIDLRYTTISGRDETYLIPNSTLLSSPIKLRRGAQSS
jgi:small-conductance mechanosensitive channel